MAAAAGRSRNLRCRPRHPAREIVELKASLEAAKKKLAAQVKPLKDQLKNKEKESPVPANLLAYAVREGPPTDVKIQKGGNPHDLGELVHAGCRSASMTAPPWPSPKTPAAGSSSPAGLPAARRVH